MTIETADGIALNRTNHISTESGGEEQNPDRRRRLCLLFALAGMLAVAGWQAATVHYNYSGNWTALFCTGDFFKVPAELSAGTYVFKSSTGYDGQFYRYVSHDPWFQRGFAKYVNAARWRYWRILVPGMAWLLAGGQFQLIDAAFIVVILAWVFLGIYWLGSYAASLGRHPAWGLGFLLIPGVLISVDRLTVDVALAALCAGFMCYAKRGSPVRLYLVLILAGLTRETGLLLIGAYCLHELWSRRWRGAMLYATAAVPALAWYVFVAMHVTQRQMQLGGLIPTWFFRLPLVGLVVKLFHPGSYPFAPPLAHFVQALDAIALCGYLLALGLAIWGLRKLRFDAEQWVIVLFIGLTLVISVPGFWRNVYNYGRVVSPLVFLVALGGLAGRSRWAFAPILMMDLRVAAQWAPQVWGVLRGMLQ
jgi:hypothetical protein